MLFCHHLVYKTGLSLVVVQLSVANVLFLLYHFNS